MSLGLVSVLLILFVVIGAIATKRVEICGPMSRFSTS